MSRRSLVLLACCVSFAARLAAAGTPEAGFTDTPYVTGLDSPTATAFLPDGRMLVTEKGGDLLLRAANGSTSTLVSIPVCTGAEMGLLGIALDPAFASNGFVYLYRTKAGAGGCGDPTGRFNQIVRVTMAADDTVAIGSLTELLSGIPTDNGNHDGGVLRMGADGKLYVGAGDTGNGDNQGGPGSSTNPYAQDLGSLAGKILRLNLDGSAPGDNPFVSTAGARAEIFAYGFRNPFRMSFDPSTGRLWVGDVGDETVEEIDIVTSGNDYAWPHCEATRPTGCEQAGDVDPIFQYPHSGGTSLGQCLIGGSFAGAAFGGMAGDYVFGDCVSSNVYLATPNGSRDGISGDPVLVSSDGGTPSDFVTGPDGAVYYVAFSGGEVRRLALAPSGVDTLITGKTLTLRANPSRPTGKSVRVNSKDANIDLGGGNGSSDDPTLNGATLRVQSDAGFDSTYALPASGWKLVGKPNANKGYTYHDRALVNGPITSASIKNGRTKTLTLSGRGAALGHVLDTNPDPVNVTVETGTKRYCLAFGGTTKFTATKLFSAKDAPAPAACAP